MALKVGSLVVIDADPNRTLVVGGFTKSLVEVWYYDVRGELRSANVPKDILIEQGGRAERSLGEFKLAGKHFE